VLDSYVVRLVARDRAAGRIAGEVEIVSTGLRVAVTSVEELLAVLAGEPLGTDERGEG
jgi:hypothetical protein